MALDVVIIGAGPGGLAAAMLLRKAGARVKVFERKNRVGGRTSTLEHNGYRFDIGPTFFMCPQILREIYEECGEKLEDRVELRRLDPHYKLHFENRGTLMVSPNRARMEQEVSRVSPADAGGFSRFMADNRRKFASFAPILQRPFSSFLDLLDPQVMGALPYLRPAKSVDADLRSFFRDDRIRLAFSFQSKYLGMSPFTCPSLYTILSFFEYEFGIHHPVGGCGAVSNAMMQTARDLGAEFFLSEPVTGIRFENKRARGIETPSGEYPCDALVINADFSRAMKELVPNSLRKRWSDKALQKKKYSCSTFMIYLGLNRQFPELHHHNIFLTEDYNENLTDIERDHRLSGNPSFYVCNPCVTDPGMAPPGKSALYILVPVTHMHGNVDWTREARRFRDLTLRQLEKIGVRGIESAIEFEHVLPPSGWDRDYSVHKAAVFNLAHSLGQSLFLRPQNRFKELDGVYLVGGGTHPGSGLPVIYESARITSRLIQKDLMS